MDILDLPAQRVGVEQVPIVSAARLPEAIPGPMHDPPGDRRNVTFKSGKKGSHGSFVSNYFVVHRASAKMLRFGPADYSLWLTPF